MKAVCGIPGQGRTAPGRSGCLSIPRPSHLALALALASTLPVSAAAELQRLDEGEMASVSGQRGISIEIPQLRINAHTRDSVDDPNTPQNEGDGRRTTGFKFDYVTREHGGAGEAHFFVEEVSLAVDITGALTFDIEEDGALLIGLPERVNYVGDGYSLHGIYLNDTGIADPSSKLLNEINVQGNFNTGGTIRMWGE